MPSYSLWLEPPNGNLCAEMCPSCKLHIVEICQSSHNHPLEGPLKTKLEARIGALSAQQGGPSFQPHVTLVPGYSAPSNEAAVSAARTAVEDLKVGAPWCAQNGSSHDPANVSPFTNVYAAAGISDSIGKGQLREPILSMRLCAVQDYPGSDGGQSIGKGTSGM